MDRFPSRRSEGKPTAGPQKTWTYPMKPCGTSTTNAFLAHPNASSRKSTEDNPKRRARHSQFQHGLPSAQQVTIVTLQPGRVGFHCTRKFVTEFAAIRRMASNSPLFWL